MINNPLPTQIPELKKLWKLAFGDEDAFIDCFFANGFSQSRCRCITEDATVTAALYWFSMEYGNQKIAYLYGVATHPEYRGQGLCRRLMEDTHRHLATLGYHSVLLVPQTEALRGMYRGMGYRDCTAMTEFFCTDGPYPVPMHAIDALEYADLRRAHLPEGSVIQEGSNLDFLSAYARFHKGMDFIMASYTQDEKLFALEFLGNREAAPGILCALGLSQGTFRTPGDKLPFAMFLPLREDSLAPSYFGFAFD